MITLVDMFREVGSGVRSSPHRFGSLFGCTAGAVSLAARALGACAEGPAGAFAVFRGHKTLLLSGFKNRTKQKTDEGGNRYSWRVKPKARVSLKVLGKIGEAC